ncbi:MAG: hypothetical protein IPO81_09390 [Kouleothrix sp.]|nr:hypothetical protein [Kouleothrix sp.]
MTAPTLSRPSGATAAPLDAAPRRALAMTINISMDGFPVEISFDGSLDQLPAITKRLRALGAEPAAAPAPKDERAPVRPERVTPSYDSDGNPCCPVHKRPLSDGAHGLFCSAKARTGQVADKKGYCGLKFEA